MKLATAQEVLERMSMQTGLSGVTSSADSVLNAATIMIENLLGSPLAAAERIDFFDHMPSNYESWGLNQQKFYLTQMFVDGGINVYLSPDGTPITTLTGLTPLASGVQLFGQDGEFLLTTSSAYKGRATIAVKYAAGFSDASADIPYWLRETAISGAVRVMHSQTIAHNKKDIPDMSVELHRIMYQQINAHIRTRNFGRFPANTVVL